MIKRFFLCIIKAHLLIFFSIPFFSAHGIDPDISSYFISDSLTTDSVVIQRPGRVRGASIQDTLISEDQQPTYHIIETDTTRVQSPEIIPPKIQKAKSTKKHSPTKAAMLSATLPGLGQIYNRKYWKVPIVYAGIGAVVYFVNFNNNEYQNWRKAYLYRVDGNPNTIDDYPNYSADVLERAMNYYRRNLEISYIAGGLVYVLNILDASVDAHLFDFDVSEDLTINLQPGFVPIPYGNSYKGVATGISLRVRF
jgi:hypothetical protein